MDESFDIHRTAAAWFAAKIANGERPCAVIGGALDGLRYFAIDLGGWTYWLTDAGLFSAPDETGRKSCLK